MQKSAKPSSLRVETLSVHAGSFPRLPGSIRDAFMRNLSAVLRVRSRQSDVVPASRARGRTTAGPFTLTIPPGLRGPDGWELTIYMGGGY
jgi:hypothetical protein